MPVTAWQDRFVGCGWLIRLAPANGLDKPSAADAFQVRSISARRFARNLGRLDDADLARVSEALRLVLQT